jgi:alpha-D-ribose 1-methylphosphonate 5-triphosphate diphosphatase
MSVETIFANARVVTRDSILDGSVQVRDGVVRSVDAGPAKGIDLEGDFLLPGLVELHTDNLEKHFSPRPGVRWPGRAAVVAHDAQVAASGITTVFDALALGDVIDGSARVRGLEDMRDAIHAAAGEGMLRAEHFLHLRCEVSYGPVISLFEPFLGDPALKLVSVMDHTPGQRQFKDIAKYREYYLGKFNMAEDVFNAFVELTRRDHAAHSANNRREVVRLCEEHGLVLASHDDATEEHVAQAVRDRMAVAEFPTTVDAARASRDAGMAILMGGPNLMLGGSHSGNIAALDLATLGLLDIVSSDYVPSCLVHAPFLLADQVPDLDLPSAVRLVSLNPARAAGLDDRGEIAAGLRADLVRVRIVDGEPVVRGVWRNGERVA